MKKHKILTTKAQDKDKRGNMGLKYTGDGGRLMRTKCSSYKSNIHISLMRT